MKIILPKTFVDVDANPAWPIFFLAGPVRGGDDWQQECCKEIELRMPGLEFYVAIPYYHQILPTDHPLAKIRTKGDEGYFERQLNWERYYMDLASKRGCLMFWLPAESTRNPRTSGGPYATDTRGEIGEWRGRLMGNPELHVSVGCEEAFVSSSQIVRNFKLALGKDYPIHTTLSETVLAGVKKAVQ